MFILRRFTSESSEINIYVGQSYNLVQRQVNHEEFKKAIETLWKGENEKIYGFVIYDNGAEFQPLWEDSVYYMMTEKGSTFANLTKK